MEFEVWGFEPVSGGITSPLGFTACGIHCGIKKNGARDLAVISSDVLASAAGVFTRNVVKAAPVLVSQRHLKNTGGMARAIVANSGNANAATGEDGLRDAERMAGLLGEELGIPSQEVLVASTGVIGVRLPMDKVEAGIRGARARLSRLGGEDAAWAILTTDKVPKVSVLRGHLGGKEVTIAGIAKGSGMIHPNMATMLSFITTDVAITPEMLRVALLRAVEDSFNMVTVDGDMSTNDSVFVLANGLAGNPPIEGPGDDLEAFSVALSWLCLSLARMIAKDGEGATKLVEVRVKGARSRADARRAARSIASSNLVKTAVFGEDPNWGRILAALGYSGIDFDPARVGIWIGDVKVAACGTGLPFDEEEAKAALKPPEVAITVDLGLGQDEAVSYSCDLTYDYVKINASYRS